jgi:hypothetical protein
MSALAFLTVSQGFTLGFPKEELPFLELRNKNEMGVLSLMPGRNRKATSLLDSSSSSAHTSMVVSATAHAFSQESAIYNLTSLQIHR